MTFDIFPNYGEIIWNCLSRIVWDFQVPYETWKNPKLSKDTNENGASEILKSMKWSKTTNKNGCITKQTCIPAECDWKKFLFERLKTSFCLILVKGFPFFLYILISKNGRTPFLLASIKNMILGLFVCNAAKSCKYPSFCKSFVIFWREFLEYS